MDGFIKVDTQDLISTAEEFNVTSQAVASINVGNLRLNKLLCHIISSIESEIHSVSNSLGFQIAAKANIRNRLNNAVISDFGISDIQVT